jgi:hypothetical protein
MEDAFAKEKERTASLESEKSKLKEEISRKKAKADEDNSALKLPSSMKFKWSYGRLRRNWRRLTVIWIVQWMILTEIV